jgi:hypothetical protein
LLDALAAVMGSDVAASDDVTGAALQGGDWQLEFRHGAIDAVLPFGVAGLESYAGTLASVAVTTTLDQVDGNTGSLALLNATPGADGKISLREAIWRPTRCHRRHRDRRRGDLPPEQRADHQQPLTVAGASATATIIDGNNHNGVFVINTTQATITGVTVSGADAPHGAIEVRHAASLTLTAAMLRDNQGDNGGDFSLTAIPRSPT